MAAARPTATALAIGTAGGAAAFWLGVPAPWICGAMVAVAAAAIVRIEVGMVIWLRQFAFLVLGFSMGASITPATIERLALWPLSLVFLAGSVVAVTLLIRAYLVHVHGWDRTTAGLAAVPGAFSFVMILAGRTGADSPRVAVAQLMRLLVLTALLPSLLGQLADGPLAAAAPAASGSLLELALGLLATALVGLLVERLGLPAGTLVGAMIASGVIHGAGLSAARLPPAVLIPCFIVTGAFIGARFAGVALAELARTVGAGLVTVGLAILVSGAFALLAARLLGLPLGLLWLAYAPGGVEVMAIMALALDLDPAFVATHHLARFLALSLVVPLWLRLTR
jgi:hypothetical protein